MQSHLVRWQIFRSRLLFRVRQLLAIIVLTGSVIGHPVDVLAQGEVIPSLPTNNCQVLFNRADLSVAVYAVRSIWNAEIELYTPAEIFFFMLAKEWNYRAQLLNEFDNDFYRGSAQLVSSHPIAESEQTDLLTGETRSGDASLSVPQIPGIPRAEHAFVWKVNPLDTSTGKASGSFLLRVKLHDVLQRGPTEMFHSHVRAGLSERGSGIQMSFVGNGPSSQVVFRYDNTPVAVNEGGATQRTPPVMVVGRPSSWDEGYIPLDGSGEFTVTLPIDSGLGVPSQHFHVFAAGTDDAFLEPVVDVNVEWEMTCPTPGNFRPTFWLREKIECVDPYTIWMPTSFVISHDSTPLRSYRVDNLNYSISAKTSILPDIWGIEGEYPEYTVTPGGYVNVGPILDFDVTEYVRSSLEISQNIAEWPHLQMALLADSAERYDETDENDNLMGGSYQTVDVAFTDECWNALVGNAQTPVPDPSETATPEPDETTPPDPNPSVTPTPTDEPGVTPTPTKTPTPIPDEGPAQIDPNAENQIVFVPGSGQQVLLTIPAGAVAEAIELRLKRSTNPPQTRTFSLGGVVFEIDALRDVEVLPNFTFAKPVVLVITYRDEDVAGLDESKLTLRYWDEAASAWSGDGITVVERSPEQNRITVEITHLTLFALGVPASAAFLPAVER